MSIGPDRWSKKGSGGLGAWSGLTNATPHCRFDQNQTYIFGLWTSFFFLKGCEVDGVEGVTVFKQTATQPVTWCARVKGWWVEGGGVRAC